MKRDSRYIQQLVILDTPHNSHFGDIVNHGLNSDLVVVCRNFGGGWIPFKVCLPHQVYVKNIEADFKENPSVKCYGVLPCGLATEVAEARLNKIACNFMGVPLSPPTTVVAN